MNSYDTKMFREKPYTQCFQCIQGNRLKCKKCMQLLIQNVLQHRSCKQAYGTKRKIVYKQIYLHSKTNKLKISESSHRKSVEQECQVNTVYELWMDRMKAKRQKSKNAKDIPVHVWPNKKSPNNQTIHKVQSPKFESWQARLLQRFSSISAQQLGINIHHKIR